MDVKTNGIEINNENLFMEMVHYYKNDPKQIQHLLKVTSFAKIIADKEEMDEKMLHTLIAAAIVHDIGIKKSLEVYGDSIGPHQEELGPNIAREMMKKLGYACDEIERVAFLVGHHHTYNKIDQLDYQILVEADFLVNIYESNYEMSRVESIQKNIFKTKTGLEILSTMFDLK